MTCSYLYGHGYDTVFIIPEQQFIIHLVYVVHPFLTVSLVQHYQLIRIAFVHPFLQLHNSIVITAIS